MDEYLLERSKMFYRVTLNKCRQHFAGVKNLKFSEACKEKGQTVMTPFNKTTTDEFFDKLNKLLYTNQIYLMLMKHELP